ncbi:MAG: hypothetical protein AAF715_19470 [Myxococcota bacterium]
MSGRSGYSDGYGNEIFLYRGAVRRALLGKRGRQALLDMRDALDAMPVKRLHEDELLTAEGQACALGALAAARGKAIEIWKTNSEDHNAIAELLDIAPSMAREIAFENDECLGTPEQRWEYMRKWVDEALEGKVW